MFKMDIDWGAYTGSAAMALADAYVEGELGTVPTQLASINGLDYMVNGAADVVDVFLGHKFRGFMGDALDGAAIDAVGNITRKLVTRTVAANASTSGTGANVDYMLADATYLPPVAPASVNSGFLPAATDESASFEYDY